MSYLGDNFDDSGPEDWEPEEPDWGALEPTDDDLREMEYPRLEAIWGPEADRVESASYSFERARSLSERDSLVRIEALTTRAGWLDFAVHLEDAVEGLGVALADLPPPKVEWAVALGSAGDQLERDVDWEVHFNGLELTVALLEPGDDPMLWRRLHEHRGTLVQRTQEWTTRDADAYDDYIVKWQVLAQANDRHIHLDSSEQVHAALVVALAEASSRVWISVPWWRADNRYGAAVVDLAARSASRGIDVRVMVRPPDRGNFGPDHSKQIVSTSSQGRSEGCA